MPNELLCGLAESLLDNTVFGIVDNLMDIQHVTEKQFFQQRLQFMNKHTCECFIQLYFSLIKIHLLLKRLAINKSVHKVQ